MSDSLELERRVASIFRALGAEVAHDVVLAGNQIDVFVTEQTNGGAIVRRAIECKSFRRPVGIEIINAYASLALLLRGRQLIDNFSIVSKSGFTRHARQSAQEHAIDLLELEDLESRIRGQEILVNRAELVFDDEVQKAQLDVSPKKKRAFAVMPFSQEYNDIYILGIRDVAEDLGIIAQRADEIEHNQSIPDVISSSIRNCDVVIADTTLPNPNVFYEVGLAHGIGKPTVLICRDVKSLPFDIGAINHIVYGSIVQLRERLAVRLKAVLGI